MNEQKIIRSIDLACKLIAEQFPEYANLPISEVEKQGHDNRTYRLGRELLIRMPTAESYALKIPKEQELPPKLAKHLSFSIPVPIGIGKISEDYPYPFGIYKYLSGISINLLALNDQGKECLSLDLAKFLKELQAIKGLIGPKPGLHNWYRGDHISVYQKDAYSQVLALADLIDQNQAVNLLNKACATKWNKLSVWIHGDFAIGNMLIEKGKLSAVIDFGGAAIGDPSCDLVIAWTYLSGKSRKFFIREMDLDQDTWLRARAWALWKATYKLCNIEDKNSVESKLQQKIIEEVING